METEKPKTLADMNFPEECPQCGSWKIAPFNRERDANTECADFTCQECNHTFNQCYDAP